LSQLPILSSGEVSPPEDSFSYGSHREEEDIFGIMDIGKRGKRMYLQEERQNNEYYSLKPIFCITSNKE